MNKRFVILIKKDATIVHKLCADRRSIGSISSTPFTTQELELNIGSMLYLASDGYADQNNVAREKLGSNKLDQLISTYTHLPAHEQKELLESTLDTHQKGSEQRDDITLIGIKL